MAEDTDHADHLAEASRLLAQVADDAECVDEDDEEWADDARTVREAYTRAWQADPESLEAAAGLAVLAGAELRFHVVNHVEDAWWEEDLRPLPEIPADDEAGRRLVDEAVRTARQVLSLDPDNNLAVYLEGLAHEGGGAHEEALRCYARALELDPWDETARSRARALDDAYDPPRHEGPDPNPHSRHFWLLRDSSWTSNSGDEEVTYWRLGDPADVRDAIETVVADKARYNPDLPSVRDGGIHLITYAPGRPPSTLNVYDALRPAPSGPPAVDWTAVVLEEPPPGRRLPPGQPVRVDGRVHFDGEGERIEE
ncbi:MULTISPECIES: tetratricopeptide repeat protein [unclassified Streptomyces]|uniref:tetratricopeptide repeat protein n=1 Tax=unclassified Streptomyces TaxID=2593676 RepID=UPI00336AC261